MVNATRMHYQTHSLSSANALSTLSNANALSNVTGFGKTLRMGFYKKITIATQIVSMTFELIAQQI